MNIDKNSQDYQAWLGYNKLKSDKILKLYKNIVQSTAVIGDSVIVKSIKEELKKGIKGLFGLEINIKDSIEENKFNLLLAKIEELEKLEKNEFKDKINNEITEIKEEGYFIKQVAIGDAYKIIIGARTDCGLLYGMFNLLRMIQMETKIENLDIVSNPANPIRMINHWDNLDGSIERGYAGKSIFYKDNKLKQDMGRIRDYARMLSSIGINSISINNVNVHQEETRLISDKLDMVKRLAEIFKGFGIQIFLSINYASPLELSSIDTADPLDSKVREWWSNKVEEIYKEIPDFGGFLVKADSEHRPGPFTYDRSHAEGANMLADALQPFGGLLIWRAFVYDCEQDWRDYETDRARAAYDNFKPLDGEFKDNVILQIKNGPMDFQVREPVSPLFGAMPETNQILELQITQEYTGQQRHLCYLLPQWKEVLEFDTYAQGSGSKVKRVVDGSLFKQQNTGFAAVVNVGDDENWTGHTLAQSNLYGYGRLAWNPDLSAAEITDEWVRITFGNDQLVIDNISQMLLDSWIIYENYTSPLGIGWMVNPGHHYGPNVDGYEYSRWGTYHRADHFGIGVDRTVKTGTGYTEQYFPENAEKYESLEQCPDELILFFHHVPYTYRLKSGKTVIQHIYDTHFTGVKQADKLKEKWQQLEDKLDKKIYKKVLSRLEEQAEHSREWRDIINSYFYRKSAIADEKNRKTY
ncbi:MAG: alpha-glucuronidase family glycosyl hydrolase [Halothermotrichaceae bacterium]